MYICRNFIFFLPLTCLPTADLSAYFCHTTEQLNPTKLSFKLAFTLQLSRAFTLTPPARIQTSSHSHLLSIHPSIHDVLTHSSTVYAYIIRNACMHPSIQNACIQRSPFRISPFTANPSIHHPCTCMHSTRMSATIHACIHRSCMHSPIYK